MSELRVIGVGILVVLLVILVVVRELWPYHVLPPLPKRFTVRWLLIVTTVLAVLIGAVVALDDVIVRALR